MACRLSCLVEPILRRSECLYRVGHLIDTLRKPACVPNGTLAFLDLTILLQRLPFTIPVTSLASHPSSDSTGLPASDPVQTCPSQIPKDYSDHSTGHTSS